MRALILALASVTAQAQTVDQPDLSSLSVFATIEFDPSFDDLERVKIGTFSPRDTPGIYWFLKETEDRGGAVTGRALTDSASCPSALPVLNRLESLDLPRPDVPGRQPDFNLLVMDGALYRLTTSVRHPDGQPGKMIVESNVGTPLSQWADALFDALENCWRPD